MKIRYIVLAAILCGSLLWAVSATAEGFADHEASVKKLIVKIHPGTNLSFGSGVIFSVQGEDLYIMTAHHVIQALAPKGAENRARADGLVGSPKTRLPFFSNDYENDTLSKHPCVDTRLFARTC